MEGFAIRDNKVCRVIMRRPREAVMVKNLENPNNYLFESKLRERSKAAGVSMKHR